MTKNARKTARKCGGSRTGNILRRFSQMMIGTNYANEITGDNEVIEYIINNDDTKIINVKDIKNKYVSDFLKNLNIIKFDTQKSDRILISEKNPSNKMCGIILFLPRNKTYDFEVKIRLVNGKYEIENEIENEKAKRNTRRKTI
jgi:hypothetical protein